MVSYFPSLNRAKCFQLFSLYKTSTSQLYMYTYILKFPSHFSDIQQVLSDQPMKFNVISPVGSNYFLSENLTVFKISVYR